MLWGKFTLRPQAASAGARGRLTCQQMLIETDDDTNTNRGRNTNMCPNRNTHETLFLFLPCHRPLPWSVCQQENWSKLLANSEWSRSVPWLWRCKNKYCSNTISYWQKHKSDVAQNNLPPKFSSFYRILCLKTAFGGFVYVFKRGKTRFFSLGKYTNKIGKYKKNCQRHNGPKALSTLTHSTPLVQSSTCFNKLWILGQTSAWFCSAKGKKYIEHLWQIHVTTLTNPWNNL